jgi:hypothetical protein
METVRLEIAPGLSDDCLLSLQLASPWLLRPDTAHSDEDYPRCNRPKAHTIQI